MSLLLPLHREGCGIRSLTALSNRYIVYHSLVAIVRQCFRPESVGGSGFEARRSLTTALQFLSAMEGS